MPEKEVFEALLGDHIRRILSSTNGAESDKVTIVPVEEGKFTNINVSGLLSGMGREA